MAMGEVKTGKSAVELEGGYYLKQRSFDQTLTNVFGRLGISSIEDCRRQDLVMDWSSTYYHDLGTLLWSIVLLHQFKKQGCRTVLKLPDVMEPKGERVWSFLKRWKFFEALNSCVDHPGNLLPDDQVPWLDKKSRYTIATDVDEDGNVQQLYTGRLLEITNFLLRGSPAAARGEMTSDVAEYVNRWKSKVVAVALKNLCGWSEDVARGFSGRVVSEGISNSIIHADGTFLLVGMRVDDRNLHLVVVDPGSGIPDALRAGFAENKRLKSLARKSDSELISYYTQPEMILDSKLIRLSTRKGTSSQEARAGFGLYYLKKVVLDYGGELRIRSGRAYVDFFKEREDAVDELVKSPGTMLRVLMPRRS